MSYLAENNLKSDLEFQMCIICGFPKCNKILSHLNLTRTPKTKKTTDIVVDGQEKKKGEREWLGYWHEGTK